MDSVVSGLAVSSAAGKLVGDGQGPVLDILGTANEVKLTGEETGGRLSMFVVTAGPGDGVPPHVHSREDEVFHVLDGRIEFTLDGRTTIAEPGTTVFLPAHRPHAWFVTADGPARAVLLTVPGTFDAFFAELACPPGQRRPTDEVVAICRRHGIEFVS